MRAMLKEPSTYAGIALVVQGVGQVFHDSHTNQIASAIVDASPHFISGNWLGGLMSLLGLAAIFLREKGKPNV